MQKSQPKLFTPPVPPPRYQQSFLGGIGATMGFWGVAILAGIVWAAVHFGVGR